MPTEIIVPPELVEQTLAPNTVLFVGAGLSIAAGLPGWPDLLRQMIAWAEEHGVALGGSKKELKQLLTQGKFLSVAQELREQIGEQRFKAFMELVFRDDAKLPTSVHRLFPHLPFTSVLTTNYDVLLESAYAVTNGYYPRTYTQADTAALADLNRHGRFYILKVHGDIDRIETVVLGRNDYREVMFANTAYREFLAALFLSRTVLFVGYSLKDPDLLLLLDEMQTAFRGYGAGHYALLSSSEAGQIERKRWQLDYGIQVIPYVSTHGHPEVLQFLFKLSSEVTMRRVPQAVEEVWRGLPHGNYIVRGVTPEAAALFVGQLASRVADGQRSYEFHLVQFDLQGMTEDDLPVLMFTRIMEDLDRENPSLGEYIRGQMAHKNLTDSSEKKLWLLEEILDAASTSTEVPIRVVIMIHNADQFARMTHFPYLLRGLVSRGDFRCIALWGKGGPKPGETSTLSFVSPWHNVFHYIEV